MRRRKLIAGIGGVAGAAAATLALGALRSRPVGPPPGAGLPLPIDRMDWQLTDDRGRITQPRDWLGQTAMVFFGFTFCPDVCPTTLLNISDWLLELGPDAEKLAVSLISVDPARDTPQALADYLSNFDPRIRGLTQPGTALTDVAAAFRARFERIERDGNYTMNHTAGVFLFRPDGRFASIIDFHEDPKFAMPKIRRALG